MEMEAEYKVFYKTEMAGYYYVYEDGSSDYSASQSASDDMEGIPPELTESVESERPLPFFSSLMKEKNRVHGTRKTIYKEGNVRMVRIPEDVDTFYIYRRSAEKGDPDYSDEDHSAPHCEGYGPIEGMSEWASWYCFNKRDDGTFEAELDEAWWWGGGHNDGGTIHREIPEDWFSLPYDDFLRNVVTLASASHYGFTAEQLKEREGLREFFGFDK